VGRNTRFPILVQLLPKNDPRHKRWIRSLRKRPPPWDKGKSNCIRVWVYQKSISKRLGIPAGDRRKSILEIPDWIWDSNDFLIWYLKGLFEAEGSLSIHLPSCTYNFAFSNRNGKLLDNVKRGLIKLGFHPEVRNNAIRLRKKAEVECFRKLICFREFSAG